MVAAGLRFIRRARPDGYDYFVVNHSNKAIDAVPLAVPFKSALIMDPRFDNRSGVVLSNNANTGQTATSPDIALTIQPNESYFIRTYTDRIVTGQGWQNFHDVQPAVPLAGTWSVSFIDGGPVLPKPYSVDKLASWTTAPDAEARRFAGTAKYTLQFTLPAQRDARSGIDRLDLGKVADSARVTLNGKLLGTLWAPPYQFDLPALPGNNVLEIEVTNVAANRIRDMDQRGVQWKIFRDANVLSTAYTAFDASNWPIRDAGLLGPVTITQMAINR
jgi:hypothetical protein